MAGAITRLAPTPSGYLHAGNAINFLIVDRLAREADAAIALRIDDMDAPRYRSEYADDIFDVLRWLDITWDIGPHDRADFETSYSLRGRTDYYRAELDDAQARGLEVFACRCSRSDATAARTQGCVGDCPGRAYPLVHGESALRAPTPYGDVVLWRRDDMPAYHLASIIEDRDLRTTLVVRGEDLRDTTAIQRHLAPYLAADAFAAATFVHHGLLTGPDGGKLSKSTLAVGPLLRTDARRAQLQEWISSAAFA